ncbi:tRNA 4-thiouridine(8) synthase ThiI [Halomonas campisalis]|uniref:Probable tRNA sulfurtransferase n=1 Tax=Billgrantia campisalis TaxID=74661 RepID=A0ABS9P310_9GAMM|nr:tRNA uracil 4-sulfurtransferase ThiI [Halomonas campisalis]MCG6656170.1 tRNA 4-thiouridine(8) synthase ThiI [Halomonas campisalis]MDR5861356.1 tRNA 4-thiouridine(8) synthase ThiI [Halomonas campisalis]
MYYLLKLFPEITIKSPSVRRQMTRCLVSNVRNALRPFGDGIRVQGGWDALRVSVAQDADPHWCRDVETALARIPGIHEIQVVEEVAFTSFDDTARRLVEVWQAALAGRCFRVSVKRRGQHDFSSEDLERYLGRALLDAEPTARVNLKHPDVDLRVEVDANRLRLVRQRWGGLGGYPLGVQGQALALISGGYDSPVAAWKMIRRGIKTHFLFFSLGGSAHEPAVREVAHQLWRDYSLSHRVKFISIPFEEVVAEMQRSIPDGLIGVVLKRMMMRAASRVANRARIPMLVTGDAVAQVSSQSLTNLALMDEASDLPILRPLIAEDKQDIIDTARRIGTARFAEVMPEVCGAISRRPNIKAPRAKVLEAEQDFDFTVLDQAVQQARMTRSDRLMEDLRPPAEVRIVQSPNTLTQEPGLSVIDIRAPDEREAAPLSLPVEPLTIPFYELQSRADSLPDDRHYLLYCEQGVMSRLQALHLADRGLTHFGVYREAASTKP